MQVEWNLLTQTPVQGLVKVPLAWAYPKKACVRSKNRLSAACAATTWQQKQQQQKQHNIR